MSIVMDSNAQATPEEFLKKMAACLELRLKDPSLSSTNALRLFNGFYEGFPGLTVDKFGGTLVISDHERQAETLNKLHEITAHFLIQSLPIAQSVLLKQRRSQIPEERNGKLILGEKVTTSIEENGVSYALNLRLNQDCSFYPDTRNLRLWLTQQLKDARVLNCFAYTGALGIAALAGGAREVVQTDLNPNFLAVAKRSLALNQFQGTMKILSQDFYPMVAGFKNQSELFDCVILDAPLFSQTRRGKVDLLQNWHTLVNKVRPLVAHEGWLVAINNALFLPGNALMESVSKLSSDGYLEVLQTVSVPEDVTGYGESIVSKPPVDPAPFNHPTKIIIMRAHRKDGRRA